MNLDDLADRTYEVTAAQGGQLDGLCQWLRGALADPPGSADEAATAAEGLCAVTDILRQASPPAAAPGAAGWTAAHLDLSGGQGSQLSLRGPAGDRLVFHLNAQAQPYLVTWSDDPSGFSENMLTFYATHTPTGWRMRVEGFDNRRDFAIDDTAADAAWGKKPARRAAPMPAPAAAPPDLAPAAAPPAPSAAPEVCARCGAALLPGRKFCGACGAPVAAKPRFCAQCGQALKPNDRFCGVCGQRVASARAI